MLEKLTAALKRWRKALTYHLKGFLVKTGLYRDRINARCRKLPETETGAGCKYEIITQNERTKEERKVRVLIFSRKAMKRIDEAKRRS